MLIYKVTNKINGCIYIGQTTLTLQERRYKHEQESLNAYRKTVKFHNALLKYGFDNFVWEVIKECSTQEELDYFEKYYIQYYDSCNKNNGYNLKYGGRSGGVFSQEAKYNLGISTKAKWQNPECAFRMMEGLRKGTETVKKKASSNFVEHKCPVCGKIFRTKKWNSHTYCSLKCANINNKQDAIERFKLAAKQNHNNFLMRKQEKLPIIKQWVLDNKEIIINAKFNNLKFLNDLSLYIGLKDTRSLGKILDVQYKRDIVKVLQNMIKCTPTIQETV